MIKTIKKLGKLTIILAVFYPVIAFADINENVNYKCQPSGNSAFPECVSKSDIPALLSLVIKVLLGLVGTVAVLFIIIGGIQYVTSAGNPDSVGRAKNTILYAVIGVIVAIIAYAAVNFIIKNF